MNTQEKKLYTYQEIKTLYPTSQLDCLAYLGIVASIPSLWKVEIRNNSLNEELDIFDPISALSRHPKPSKEIYWTLIERELPPSLAIKNVWQYELKKTY